MCAGAKILTNKRMLDVGRNSIIAANGLLLNSTGENAIWAGLPAKRIGFRK